MLRSLSIALALTLTASSQAETPYTLPDELATRAARLAEVGLHDRLGYEVVESLTTEVGPRLAGTQAEARARDWAVAKFKSLGFDNVRVEPFELPVWTRGIETAEITSPYPQPLTVTALGGSASTGSEGVTGQVVIYPDLASVKALPDNALDGKVMFIDEVMTRTQTGHGYGVAVGKRRAAAYEGERLGARAALIRSVGTSSHRFAHTGQMRRITEEGPPGVPTAALSAPDADQLQRILSRGKEVSIKLVLTPQSRPAAMSGNVIAEVPGSASPDEIVLIGAHLDSWDLGTGAVDDGAGVGIVVAAAKLLMDELKPKRTIRVVLFGAEEVGLVGAKAYADRHAGELDKHIIAAESDFGAGRIWRFQTRVGEDKLPLTREIAKTLRPLGIGPGDNRAFGGPDLKYVREAGVPVVSLTQNGWDYFDLHHTPDDTLDKIDPADMAQNVAAYAVLIYLASEVPEHFRAD